MWHRKEGVSIRLGACSRGSTWFLEAVMYRKCVRSVQSAFFKEEQSKELQEEKIF